MPSISFRRLLARLSVLALSTSAVAANATPIASADPPPCDKDCEDELDPTLALELDGPHTESADALGRGLALALERMRPLGATHLLATWALAPDPVRRLALATALEWTFPIVGDTLAIDHLSRDPDPKIRLAAARAAWARRSGLADPGVLARLVDDSDPDVRAVAMSARS